MKHLTDAEYGYHRRMMDSIAGQWRNDPVKWMESINKIIDDCPVKYRKKLLPLFEEARMSMVRRAVF